MKWIINLLLMGSCCASISCDTPRTKVPDKWKKNMQFEYTNFQPIGGYFRAFGIYNDSMHFENRIKINDRQKDTSYSIALSPDRLNEIISMLKEHKADALLRKRKESSSYDHSRFTMRLTRGGEDIFNFSNISPTELAGKAITSYIAIRTWLEMRFDPSK
jgi:hypothetical protein